MPPLNPPPPFDIDAARARLGAARGPTFWRSLEELADSEDFRRWLHEQQPRLAAALSVDRRGFLKYLGASLALAGLSGCGHPPHTEIVPYVHGPVGQVDGLPRFFATTLTRAGYAHGVLGEDDMGRPTKIEGNPRHPASLGATDVFAQAAVLQLWDPDRSQSIVHGTVVAGWDDFEAALRGLTARLERSGGAGLRVLSGPVTSPTLGAQLASLLHKYPHARWHVHRPSGPDNALAGSRLAFGAPLFTRLHLERARIILALDADFLSDPAAGVRYARDFVSTRDPHGKQEGMSRLYAAEATPTVTGMMADHRLALETPRMEDLARQLARRLGLDIAAGGALLPWQADWLDALVTDLQAQRGESLIVVGAAQAPWLHALGHALNAALGNVGTTLEYTDPVQILPPGNGTLATLTAQMHAGSVDTLLILDANPVYDAPADLQFAAALRKVPHVLHLGLYLDETGERAEWHLPQAHPLEAWSDARAFDGTVSLAQPLIAPLYDGRSAHEVLSAVLGDSVRDGRGLVRRQWRRQLPDEAAWKAALQAGVIAQTALPARTPTLRHPLPLPAPQPLDSARRLAAGTALELLFRPDPTIGDGRWSNNGWLQELPKPMTQLTWDNAVLVSPQLAAQYRLADGDVIELRSHGRSLAVAVRIMPGQAARSVTLHLGYGRRRAGSVGTGQGFDAYALRTSTAAWRADDLKIVKTGRKYRLAGTQHHFNMEGRDLLRVGTLAEYRRDPGFATAHERYPGTPPSLYPGWPRGEYSWGMSIDLNACIGCKACTIACQAENNIPVVGKVQVSHGREMHWIRVDRYFEGAPDEPRSYAQPVPCMMCENAPCELVCPVEASVHDSEGLNLQVYNRCIGTRWCSNNCPYKVRRFNFLQYADLVQPQLAMQRNPQVSVRRRGVMEKCTYCIQRIENAHIVADRENRHIRDGEILTACQAVCPTQAIRFGNLADPHSQVSRAQQRPRNYALLGELNTRPHTTYLARLRNPAPSLENT